MVNINSNAIMVLIKYEGATTAAVRSIMKGVVVDRFKEKYTSKSELNAVAGADEGTKRRPRLCYVCKKVLSAMQQGEDNYPIMIIL
eukprot:10097463-Ditylum_brightwellii.AAC.1